MSPGSWRDRRLAQAYQAARKASGSRSFGQRSLSPVILHPRVGYTSSEAWTQLVTIAKLLHPRAGDTQFNPRLGLRGSTKGRAVARLLEAK